MKPIPDCLPDVLQMALAVAKAVSDEEFIHRKVMDKVMSALVEDGDFGSHPAELYLRAWEAACRALGVRDPYENEKARSDKAALGMLKSVLALGKDGEDRLAFALRISLAGAMTEFGVLGRVEVEKKLLAHLDAKPERDDGEVLLKALRKAESVMLAADRAGEIVLDQPLLAELSAMGKEVFLAVASKPVFNLATPKDVEAAGLPEKVEIAAYGAAMYGLAVEKASSEFQALFEKVDVVIAKGEINFETLSAAKREAYFILRAACPRVASTLGIAQGAGAIARMEPR